jgi:hypothetical protein
MKNDVFWNDTPCGSLFLLKLCIPLLILLFAAIKMMVISTILLCDISSCLEKVCSVFNGILRNQK